MDFNIPGLEGLDLSLMELNYAGFSEVIEKRLEWLATARPDQLPAMSEEDWSVWLFLGGRGCGKETCLSTLIPTVNGYTTMGEIRVGDQLFDLEGNICNVVQVHDIMLGKDCYEVEFSQGETFTCSGEHIC